MIPNELNSRVDDLAASLCVPASAIRTGLPEAMKVWDTFVLNMPNRLANASAFKKVLANNYEFLYSMLAMSGLALGQENVNLRDELESAEVALEEKTNEHLDTVYKLSLALPAVLWCMDSGSGGNITNYVNEEPDDLPQWKVTVTLPTTNSKVSAIVSHADMARLFGHVKHVAVDPDPEYGGLGSTDDGGFGADGDDDKDFDGAVDTDTDVDELPL